MKEVIQKEGESEVINIAVLGFDRNRTDGRSDVMKILSLETTNNVEKVTSFQRGTLSYISEDIHRF